MNNWQHAAMYFAYMISGFVDIAGFYTELPPDTEQVHLRRRLYTCLLMSARACLHAAAAGRNYMLNALQAALGIAFVTEGLLLGFHLKGAPIEILVHNILFKGVCSKQPPNCWPPACCNGWLSPPCTTFSNVWTRLMSCRSSGLGSTQHEQCHDGASAVLLGHHAPDAQCTHWCVLWPPELLWTNRIV